MISVFSLQTIPEGDMSKLVGAGKSLMFLSHDCRCSAKVELD